MSVTTRARFSSHWRKFAMHRFFLLYNMGDAFILDPFKQWFEGKRNTCPPPSPTPRPHLSAPDRCGALSRHKAGVGEQTHYNSVRPRRQGFTHLRASAAGAVSCGSFLALPPSSYHCCWPCPHLCGGHLHYLAACSCVCD